ncbi:MAG: PIN domain-containing protein [Ginsengibacter sp.]
MRIFLDANILVSVLNKEYPLFSTASRILSLADKNKYALYTSPVCLAIAFYFAEKKFKSVVAKSKIQLLCGHIQITTVDEMVVSKTLHNSAINDFEDGLEYYSALANKCDCIITEDVDDFYFSKIEILRSDEFFKKYLFGRV